METNLSDSFLSDFDVLCTKGNLGFYNSSEITNIYLIKDSKSYLNVFTLVVLEESNEFSERENITKNLYNINHNLSLGISSERINIDGTRSIFEDLLKSNEYETNTWNLDDDSLYVDNFKILSKKFVPSTDNDIPLNNALKNNDENGSYVIEFFSEEKSLFEELNENDYKKICHLILEHLPIDLLFLKDRMFNIIFQFPITLFSVETRASDDWDGLELKLGWHPLLGGKIPELEIYSSSYDDEDIVGSGVYSGTIDTKKLIKSGNIDAEVTNLIKDKKTGLFLYYYKGYYIKDITINAEVIGHSAPNKKTRIINIDNNEYKIELESIKRENILKKSYKDRINDRKYDESLIKLIEEKKFIPYGVGGSNDREKALKDLRIIIQKHSKNGVYLWDPFARSIDLLNTLYFCPYNRSEMKVITSFSKKTKSVFNEDQFENMKNNQIHMLNSNSNSEGINLEIRCQRESYGWKFHDRFLIFPCSIRGKPKAWSLGTSINNIGVQHSILMEVNNPQNILDAFNELWNDLKDSILLKFKDK